MNIEMGLLSLHLPSGHCFISGFVQSDAGSAEIGGTMRSHLPIGDGGTLVLNEGLDPMRNSTTTGIVIDLRYEPPGFDNYGFDWAHYTTCDAQADADWHGFATLSRRQAADVLRWLGYRVRPQRDPDTGAAMFHDVLWQDQIDDLTWHVPDNIDGYRYTTVRHVFVLREHPGPPF